MADILFEVKRAIDRQIGRGVRNNDANRDGEMSPQATTMAGLLQIGAAGEESAAYAAGFNGTDTTLPFTWDVSAWGGGDIWTG